MNFINNNNKNFFFIERKKSKIIKTQMRSKEKIIKVKT